MNKDRILKYKGEEYYLDEYLKHPKNSCSHCELFDICEETACTLNKIEWFACNNLNEDYMKKHPLAFFRKIKK